MGRPDYGENVVKKSAGKINPEIKLAQIIKRDLGVEIAPNTLRLFVKASWNEVSALAHDIHGKSKPTPEINDEE